MGQILLPGQPVAPVCGRAGAVSTLPLLFLAHSPSGVCRDWEAQTPQPQVGLHFCWGRQTCGWAGVGPEQTTTMLEHPDCKVGPPSLPAADNKGWLIPHSLPGWRSFSSCFFPCSHVWDSSSTCPAPPALITSSPAHPSVKIPGVKAPCE